MTTYCLVPSDLAQGLLEPLGRHFAEAGITVIADHRTGERRSEHDRRRAEVPEAIPPSGDRRRIRNPEGRRVAERRATVVAAPAPEGLPRRARRHAERLSFVERLEPSAEPLEDADTARLVIAFQTGDRDVFPTLYSRYFDRVYAYLRLLLRDRHEAEDLAQETFVRALGALPRYELRGHPFRSWLFAIARNQAITTLERSSRIELTDARRALEREAHAAAPDTGLAALGWVSDADLRVFIERLPDAQREVLVLRYLLDLTPQEIAPFLETTPNHVSVLQYRALGFLRDRLVALGREPSQSDRSSLRRLPGKVQVLRRRRFALIS